MSQEDVVIPNLEEYEEEDEAYMGQVDNDEGKGPQTA